MASRFKFVEPFLRGNASRCQSSTELMQYVSMFPLVKIFVAGIYAVDIFVSKELHDLIIRYMLPFLRCMVFIIRSVQAA